MFLISKNKRYIDLTLVWRALLCYSLQSGKSYFTSPSKSSLCYLKSTCIKQLSLDPIFCMGYECALCVNVIHSFSIPQSVPQWAKSGQNQLMVCKFKISLTNCTVSHEWSIIWKGICVNIIHFQYHNLNPTMVKINQYSIQF